MEIYDLEKTLAQGTKYSSYNKNRQHGPTQILISIIGLFVCFAENIVQLSVSKEAGLYFYAKAYFIYCMLYKILYRPK